MTHFGGAEEYTTWDGEPVSYAEACRRCRPAAVVAGFVTACEALGSE
jgi:hypothetical protein